MLANLSAVPWGWWLVLSVLLVASLFLLRYAWHLYRYQPAHERTGHPATVLPPLPSYGAEWEHEEPGEWLPDEWSAEDDEAVTGEWLASLHEPEPEPPAEERLADTGDIRSAHFLAEVTAELNAQDAEVAEFLSKLRQECQQYRLDLAGALS